MASYILRRSSFESFSPVEVLCPDSRGEWLAITSGNLAELEAHRERRRDLSSACRPPLALLRAASVPDQ